MYMVQVLEHAMVNAAIVLRTLPNPAVPSHPDEVSWHAAFDAPMKPVWPVHDRNKIWPRSSLTGRWRSSPELHKG